MSSSHQQIHSLQASIADLKVRPPISTNSISRFDASQVAADAEQTRIIVHARFPSLVQSFLDHKRNHGSQPEKALYSQAGFSWQDEVSRLINKRPLTFMGSSDFTLLRDGSRIRGDACEEWDRNGTDHQHFNRQIQLTEYLSYDEIMLSSLLGVSGPSHFVNDGNRYNRGVPGLDGTFEPRGIIVGLVGARFERDDRMDSAFVLPPVVSPKQHPDLTNLFLDFFGTTRDTNTYFDAEFYKARMRVTIDILLLEAEARAVEEGQGRKSYVYVVGLGLGVWQYTTEQPELYVTAFMDSLRHLSLYNISTIEFAWLSVPQRAMEAIESTATEKGIQILFSKRNPAAKLQSEEDVLILSYAWDGNAFPGNEYWLGSLDGSGDPAAACMSTIGELHNPLVNPFTSRIKVLENQSR